MKQLLRSIAIVAALSLVLSGCGSGSEESSSSQPAPEPESSQSTPVEQDPPQEEEDIESIRLRVMEAHTNYLGGLTYQQNLEDYEYLWEVLRDSFPFFGVMQRRGIDADEVYEAYKAKLADLQGDIYLITFYNQVFEELQNTAHLSLISGASQYESYKSVYQPLGASNKRFQLLYDTLDDPKAAGAYEKLGEVETEIFAAMDGLAGEEPPDGEEEGAGEPQPDATAIEAMEVLEDGTAYVHISQFSSEALDGDREKLMEFFRGNADAANLIIDIRGNGGGTDAYWQDNLLTPLLREPITTRQYSLFQSGAVHTDAYLRSMWGYDTAQPTTELPDLPALNADDLQSLDRFMVDESRFEPTGDSIGYEGKIWVLVDQSVYSASETFSMVCKDTGFATLVGTTTGGDGGGVDPVLTVLPNSGLIFRFSVLYTLNADGSNSEETATTPDILIADGADALELCLEEIAKG